MHVVAELGHVRDRRVADPLLEPRELAPLPAGDVLEVGEVLVPRREPRRGVAAAPRRARARACPQHVAAPSAEYCGVHPVHDERVDRELAVGEPLREVLAPPRPRRAAAT